MHCSYVARYDVSALRVRFALNTHGVPLTCISPTGGEDAGVGGLYAKKD